MQPLAKRPIPQAELERIADAGVQLVEVAKALAALMGQAENPHVRAQLEAQASRLLDIAEVVSSAARSATYA